MCLELPRLLFVREIFVSFLAILFCFARLFDLDYYLFTSSRRNRDQSGKWQYKLCARKVAGQATPAIDFSKR